MEKKLQFAVLLATYSFMFSIGELDVEDLVLLAPDQHYLLQQHTARVSLVFGK
jgi:hypothetical protein